MQIEVLTGVLIGVLAEVLTGVLTEVLTGVLTKVFMGETFERIDWSVDQSILTGVLTGVFTGNITSMHNVVLMKNIFKKMVKTYEVSLALNRIQS